MHPNHTLTAEERRWELHYGIVENYIREFKRMPDKETTFEGIGIGRWYTYQLSRAELGLLTSDQQLKMDRLEIVLSEVTPPPPILGLYEPEPPQMVRPPIHPARTVPPRTTQPKVTKNVPDLPGEEPSPVRDTEPEREPVPVTAADVPSAEPDSLAVDTGETITVEQEASGEPVPDDAGTDTGFADDEAPEASDTRTASDAVESEESETKESPVTDTTAVTDELRELIEATTDFWQTNGHMPRKANRDIIVAGRKLPDWTWTLVPAINNGTLSDEERSVLETAPWWGLILERAKKQKRRAAIIASKKRGDDETAGETPSAESADTATQAKRGAASIPEELKVRKPYVKDRPHRRNPVAREKSEEAARSVRAEEEKLSVEQLPEVGMAGIAVNASTSRDTRTYFVRAYREGLDLDQATKAITYLSDLGIAGRVQRSGRGFTIRVAFRALDATESVKRLGDLGYLIYSITSSAGFPVEG